MQNSSHRNTSFTPRADLYRFLGVTSWYAPRSNQEARPDFSSGASLPPAVLTMNGGDFAFANVLHLRGIYPTPQMGLLLATVFCFLVGVDPLPSALGGDPFVRPPMRRFAFVAGGKNLLLCALPDAHTARPCRALSGLVFRCSFFAARQRTNQENAPKACGLWKPLLPPF